VTIQSDTTTGLTGSCPTSGTYDEGDTVTWIADASGGTGSYTYSWSGDVSGSSRTEQKTYNSSGTKNSTVTITSGSESITRSCSVYIDNNYNNNDLSGYCYVSDSRVETDEDVTFYAVANGGDEDYEYDWSGDVNGNSRKETESYDDEGNYEGVVRITDGNGDTIVAHCDVDVEDDNNYNNDDSNIVLISSGGTTPASGTLSSGVFLSQIPYTGIAENMKMILFVLSLILWSAFMAWIMIKKRTQKKVLNSGLSHREMIEKFKQNNLAKRATA
jgi:hypothetical protein